MVCRSCTLVCRRRIYLELHIAGLCRVESYTWLCRIGVEHNWFTGVKVKFAGIRIILSCTLLALCRRLKRVILDYTWRRKSNFCRQQKKFSCTMLYLLLVSAEWRERSFSRPGVNNLPCQTQPGSQGGGCPALNSLFTNALLPFTQQFPQNVFFLLTNKRFKVSNAPNCETYE